ncbi:MAG: metal-dependent transcriptional regulator [Candidatus Omnitrophica bacterium]|nr:metal-dependent transcriptional regulator [Candidatus Omnitrophota bacterium]
MKAQVLGISPSLEDYIEGIFILRGEKGVARVKDLAKRLKVKASSAVEALEKLKEKRLVIHQHYGYIELTQEGINLAKKLYERHITLKKFFHQILGINEKTSEEDACRIEHYLSRETLQRIIKFINFIETCPHGKPDWLDSFYYFVEHRKRPPGCKIRALKTKISKYG